MTPSAREPERRCGPTAAADPNTRADPNPAAAGYDARTSGHASPNFLRRSRIASQNVYP